MLLMRHWKKNTRHILLVLTLVSISFSMQAFTTSLTKIKKSGGAGAPAGVDLGQAGAQSLRLNTKYYIQGLSDKELITDVINSFVSKGSRDVKRLVHPTLAVALMPVIGLWFTLACNLFGIERYHRTGSLLAFSLGGHAPPSEIDCIKRYEKIN